MTTEETEAILDRLAPGQHGHTAYTNRELFRATYREAMFWANSIYEDPDGDTFWAGTDSCGWADSEATPELTAALNAQADAFLTPKAVELIDAAVSDPVVSYDGFGQAGHDFALTRNHHGAGFWDSGIDQGDELTKLAQAEGETHIYIGNPEDPSTWITEEG